MASVRFNIQEAFERVYNVYARLPIFFPRKGETGKNLPEFDEAGPAYEEPEGVAVTQGTGLLIWDTFKIRMADTAEWYQLPLETVADLRTRKEMVVTPLAGRDGTVKELIAASDWDISFKGFLIDYQNDAYPSEKVKEIKKLFDSLTDSRANGGQMISLEVDSKQLNDLGIFKLVFRELAFPPMAGWQNACPYELTALSDEDIVIEIQQLENAS